MRRVLVLAFLLLPVTAFAASTASHQGAAVQQGTTKGGHPYFKATDTQTAEGTIISVSKKKREVSILTESGDTLNVTCGPEVKNFAQIAKGDKVKAKYTETLTITVMPPGSTPETSAEETSSTAKPGEKPSAMHSAKAQVSATVTAVDMTKGTLTLKSAEGNEVTLTPRNKQNLKKVKVDDVVVFHYEATVAASVHKETAK
jgi:hypothetical protein